MRIILTMTESLVALWWNDDADLEFRLEHCHATYINIIFSFVVANKNKIWQIMERRLAGLLQP